MGNIDFVKGVYAAFGRGDVAEVLGAMDQMGMRRSEARVGTS